MQKKTISVRVEEPIKIEAEVILNEIGLTMTTAVTLFLRQVIRTGAIPFPLTSHQKGDDVHDA